MSDADDNDGTTNVDNRGSAQFYTRTLPKDQLMSLHFNADGNTATPVVTIRADGTIEIAEGFAVGECAAMFWEAVLDQRINYARRFHMLNEAEGAPR